MAGAEPSFERVHVVRALLALGGGAVGRKKLVEILGVGEGSVRTILKRLAREGLIESSMSGHRLSKKGEKKTDAILTKIKKPVDVDIPELSGYAGQRMVVVKKASKKIKSAVGLRDIALKAGADGALILVREGGRLNYPPPSMRGKTPSIACAGCSEGDAVVVGFAKTPEKAEDGALAIALELAG